MVTFTKSFLKFGKTGFVGSHGRPQMARRTTSDYTRFGQRHEEKRRGSLTAWTE